MIVYDNNQYTTDVDYITVITALSSNMIEFKD